MNKKRIFQIIVLSVLVTPIFAQGGGIAKTIEHFHAPPSAIHLPPATRLAENEAHHLAIGAGRVAVRETHAVATSIEHAAPRAMRHESVGIGSFERHGTGGSGSGGRGGGGNGSGKGFSRTEAFNNAAVGRNLTHAGPAPTNFRPKTSQAATKQFSREKQALVDMAKVDKRKGMTVGDMQAYKALNRELHDPFPKNIVRGPERSVRPGAGVHSKQWHGRVGPVNHIPIRGINK